MATTHQATPAVAEIVDPKPQTAIERLPTPEPDTSRVMAMRPREENLGPKGYQGAGRTRLTEKQRKALMAPFADDEHEIKPTAFGEVYIGHQHVRRRLNEVIGQGEWTLVPVEFPNGALYLLDKSNDAVYSRLRLFIRGNFVAEAVGEQRWDPKNSNMTYASACEGAKSDALVRCSKDLSIAWECWDRRWTERWRKKFAIRVTVLQRGERKLCWRRRDADPLPGEQRGDASDLPSPEAPSGPHISKSQLGDLWALATEVFGRKQATDRLYEVMKQHGFERAPDITEAAYRQIVAAVERARG